MRRGCPPLSRLDRPPIGASRFPADTLRCLFTSLPGPVTLLLFFLFTLSPSRSCLCSGRSVLQHTRDVRSRLSPEAHPFLLLPRPLLSSCASPFGFASLGSPSAANSKVRKWGSGRWWLFSPIFCLHQFFSYNVCLVLFTFFSSRGSHGRVIPSCVFVLLAAWRPLHAGKKFVTFYSKTHWLDRVVDRRLWSESDSTAIAGTARFVWMLCRAPLIGLMPSMPATSESPGAEDFPRK